MSQDPLFELTKSPQLNELINKTRALYSGEITDSDFKLSVKSLNNFRRNLRTFLRDQAIYTPKTPIVDEEIQNIESLLEKIRESLEEMYLYFSDSDKGHVEKGLTRCKDLFNRVWISIENIQKAEANEEQYSKAPIQNELMKIGFALTQGKISQKAFNDKLTSLISSLKKYYAGFDLLTPQGGEREFFTTNKSIIKSAIKDYIVALEESARFFMNQDKKHINEGLRKANLFAEQLYDFQEQLTDLASKKICVKCSFENDGLSKVCSNCSAVLITADLDSHDGFKIDETGNSTTSNHIETELTRDVNNAVEKVKSGAYTKSQFKDFLEGVIKKIKQTKAEKEKIQIPEQLRGEHEASPIFLQIEELISQGFTESINGLEKMVLFAQGENESMLIFGQEEFLNGTDKFYQAKEMSLSSVSQH